MDPDYDVGKITLPYIIVMPRLPDTPIHMMGSLFSRFDENLINSIPCLRIISQLPATLGEMRLSWLDDVILNSIDTDYDIRYVYEDNVKQTFIYHATIPYAFGCIFVLDGCSDHTVELLLNSYSFPVICLGESTREDVILLSSNTTLDIYDKWLGYLREVVQKGVPSQELVTFLERGDKTDFEGYNTDSTLFLTPLSRIIDRIRGLYISLDKGLRETPPITPTTRDAREYSADIELIATLRDLISERFVTETVSQVALRRSEETPLKSTIGVEDVKNFLRNPTWQNYEVLREQVAENFGKLNFLTDMVLCVPSVNYPMIREIHQRTHIPKKLLRKIYDSNTYYGLVSRDEFAGYTDAATEGNMKIFLNLLQIRASELNFITHAHVFYGLGRRLPYIRTRNVPAQPVYMLTEAMSKYSKNMESQNKVGDFNRNVSRVSSLILDSLNTDLLKTVIKHSQHLKVISDLPIEWVNIDGLPLCLETSFSRIPLTPGNGIVGHANARSQRTVTLEVDDIDILVLNTLSVNDPLYSLGRTLLTEINTLLSRIRREAKYYHATNSADFFHVIEEHKPSILVYYGHGSYSTIDSVGRLIIGEDSIDSIELERLRWVPQIVLLGACDTQVLHGTHLNVASLFLGIGALSVLGSFFPIDGLHAFTFLVGLIRHMVNAFNGEAPRKQFQNWADIVLQTQRTHYLLEPIHSLEAYLDRRNKSFASYASHSSVNEEYWKIAFSAELTRFSDAYRYRDEKYREVFSSDPTLSAAFESIVKNRLIIPYSTFFTSIGSPELIGLKYGSFQPDADSSGDSDIY